MFLKIREYISKIRKLHWPCFSTFPYNIIVSSILSKFTKKDSQPLKLLHQLGISLLLSIIEI